MARVAGQVPGDDDPPFTKAGFLFDAPAERQRAFHDHAVACITRVHAIPAPSFLEVGPGEADHLAWCRSLREWSGASHESFAAMEAALGAGLPTSGGGAAGGVGPGGGSAGGATGGASAASLLWGDARPANMVLDEDFDVVGMLDWELAGTGPGELDVAWFCEMNRMRAEGMGLPPLPGWPDEAVTWAQWEAAVGRSAEHVGWHRRYAAYKVAVLMQLYLRAMVSRGRLPAGHRLFGDNPGTRRLAELLSGPGADPASWDDAAPSR
jgi:aminoglycoside phosphotransferase (APT) family kinase protein